MPSITSCCSWHTNIFVSAPTRSVRRPARKAAARASSHAKPPRASRQDGPHSLTKIGRGHQRSSAVISGHQWSSVVISAHQCSSVLISCHTPDENWTCPRVRLRRRGECDAVPRYLGPHVLIQRHHPQKVVALGGAVVVVCAELVSESSQLADHLMRHAIGGRQVQSCAIMCTQI